MKQLGKLTPSLTFFSKRVLIAIIVIFPIVLAVDTLIGPMTVNLPTLVTAMMYVLIISPLMTLLMPQVTKLLHSWLYPKQKNDVRI